MFPRSENTIDDTQALIRRFDEATEIIRELAKLVLPRAGEFHSVLEITNEVFDQYYDAKAA